MKQKQIFTLIVAIAIPQIAGMIGSIATTPKIDSWYATLIKPEFNPPNWIFGPIWTLLFLLMGIALYFVWTAKLSQARTKALYAFAIQLGLNVFWSFLFFGMNNPQASFAEIIILWFAILINIILFWRVKKLSAYLLLPYIGWVLFAAILNYSIWQLNI